MLLLNLIAEMAKRRTCRLSGAAGAAGAVESFALGVDGHLEALKAAVDDAAAFPRAFENLKADKAMKREDVVAIASRFAYPMAASTTRKLALERIWRQHEASETTGAKILAVGGRSAA
jgi:hypothetical protein